MRYLPLTPQDRADMLAKIGVKSVDDLFASISYGKVAASALVRKLAGQEAPEPVATSAANVYAIGDIVPGVQLAHRGYQQGRVRERVNGVRTAVLAGQHGAGLAGAQLEVGNQHRDAQVRGRVQAHVMRAEFVQRGRHDSAEQRGGHVVRVSLHVGAHLQHRIR